MNFLNNLESRIQAIFENSLNSVLPFQKPDDKFTLQIIQEVASLYHSQDLKRHYGLNYFVIIAHPEVTSRIEDKPGLVDELERSIEMEGREIGMTFNSKPVISICSDETMKLREIKVIGSYREDRLFETRGMDLENRDWNPEKHGIKNAYLLIPNSGIIHLTQLAVNIGRKVDNDIVFDDPRVSRLHAQIRVYQDRFLLIDLNSTGGTFINGERINQKILMPGDVISLAGVSMIFNVDFSATQENSHQTQTEPVKKYEPPSSGNDQV